MTSLRRMIGRFLAAAGGAVMATLLSAAGWTAHAQASALNCEIDADDPMVLVCSGIVEEPLFIGPDYFEDVQEINFPKVSIWLETDDSVVALHIEPDAPGKTFTHTGDFGEIPGVDARSGDEATALRISGAGLTARLASSYWSVGENKATGIEVTGSGHTILANERAKVFSRYQYIDDVPQTAIGMRVQGSGHEIVWDGVLSADGVDEAFGARINGSDIRFTLNGEATARTEGEQGTSTIGIAALGDDLTLDIRGYVNAYANYGGSVIGLGVAGHDMKVRIGSEENGGGPPPGSDDEPPGLYAGAAAREAFVLGLSAAGTGIIENVGQISAQQVEDFTAGEELGFSMGASVVAQGGELTLLNSGTIVAMNPASAVGVRLGAVDGQDGAEAKLVFVNDGAVMGVGMTEGASAVGVLIGAGNAETPLGDIVIVNMEGGSLGGVVLEPPEPPSDEPSGVPTVAIGLEHPGHTYRSLTLVQRGYIFGDILLGDGLNIVELAGASSVEGSIYLGNGGNVVKVAPGAEWTGTLLGGEGVDVMILEAENPDDQASVAGDFYGFDSFDVVRGHWVVSEGATADLNRAHTVIRHGASLHIQGVDDLGLNEGGVMAGRGTFVGSLYNFAGRTAPGESIGTLTIVGDYTHDADAVLDIEVDPSKPAGDPEEADLLYVTGKATIHGGKVQVTLLGPATYVSGQRDFTILKADGGVEGAFDEMGVGGELSPFLEFALSHLGPDSVTGADEVIFTIIKTASFSSVAETPNQKEVAGALDDMADGAPPDDMVTVLGELQTLDEDAARDALDRMSGEIYTWHGRLAQQAADGVARSVRSGRIPLTRGEDRLWFAQDANVVVLAGDKAYAGGQARTFAFTSGYALLQRDSGARLGVFGTLMSTDAAMPRRGSAMTGSGWALGVYGRYAGSWGYVDGLAAYGSSGYHATRDVTVGSEARRAEGSFGATVAAAAADAAFRPFDTPLGRAEITAGLTWMSSARPQVKETGAGSLSLLVDPGEDHSLRAHAGVRLWTEQTQTLLGLGAQPWFHLGWVQELSPSPRTVTARLQGLPDHAMTIGGAETPAGLLRLGAGVTFAWDDDPDASIHVQYTGEFASGVKDHALTVQGSIRF